MYALPDSNHYLVVVLNYCSQILYHLSPLFGTFASERFLTEILTVYSDTCGGRVSTTNSYYTNLPIFGIRDLRHPIFLKLFVSLPVESVADTIDKVMDGSHTINIFSSIS